MLSKVINYLSSLLTSKDPIVARAATFMLSK